MKSFRAVSLALVLLSRARSDPLIQIPPHIQTMELSTPKPVTEAQMQEFKQDFVDVDFNKDDQMDAQEVRPRVWRDGVTVPAWRLPVRPSF